MSDECWDLWRRIRLLNHAIRTAEGGVPVGRRGISDRLLNQVIREWNKRLRALAETMNLDPDAIVAGDKPPPSQRPKHGRRLSGL